MNITVFKNTTKKLLKSFCVFFILFTLYRIVFLLTYGDKKYVELYSKDILKAFEVGARFDVSVICYMFLPICLLWIVSLFFVDKSKNKFEEIYNAFSNAYLVFILFVSLSILTIDFFYYQFFSSHIDILLFGIIDDDTKAVIYSIFQDYPIAWIFIFFVCFIKIGVWIFKKINRKYDCREKVSKKYLFFLIILPCFIVGMRGSLGIFPLRRDHTSVSKISFINSLSYNGFYALKFAWSEYNENKINPDVESVLKENNFKTIEEAIELYQKKSVDSIGIDFYTKTKKDNFLKQNPPNVIFILMESMSNHYFEIHTDRMNLLGELANQLPKMYYFKNSLSSFNGTIMSLENLLISTPKVSVAQSPHYSTKFKSSVAIPFKEQGYETYFLTGAKISWRNIDNFLKNQSFDIVEGEASIVDRFPKTQTNPWGAHDQYLFDYIFDRLKNKKTKRKFIFSMTISNHTPYSVPDDYKKYPIEITNEYLNDFNSEKDIAKGHLKSFQYACDCLGKFIKKIRESEFGKNTIVVATGDHNVKHLNYREEDNFIKRSVPILFYIPEKYKPKMFNSEFISSHKDIFPTIFNLTLSDQKYIYCGDNLFDRPNVNRFAINDYNYISSEKGCLSIENGKPLFYRWKDNVKRKSEIADANSPEAKELMGKLKLFTTLQTLQIYKNIKEKNEDKTK